MVSWTHRHEKDSSMKTIRTSQETIDLEPLKVHEFLSLVNDGLEQYQESVVVGEVSEFRVSQGKWVSFNLKDEHEEALLPCFLMAMQLRVPLEDGMKVLVQGLPRVYPRFGKFSLNVKHIEAVGEGSLKRAFELTKQKLAAEGIFDTVRKRQLPAFPEIIGLITSTEAAAYTDFIKIVKARFPGLTIYVAPVQVQGKESIDGIMRAFEYFNAHGRELGIEAVVLTRGGGSLEDLHAFNSEEMARAVFGSKLPVICGVGHERDESLADYAADVRASTPSNAAELLVRHASDVSHDIAAYEDGIVHAVQGFIQSRVEAIDDATGLWFQSLQTLLRQCKTNVQSQIRLLESYNPRAVLRRGYSIARNTAGHIVKRVTDVQTEDRLDVTVSDGTIQTVVR